MKTVEYSDLDSILALMDRLSFDDMRRFPSGRYCIAWKNTRNHLLRSELPVAKSGNARTVSVA